MLNFKNLYEMVMDQFKWYAEHDCTLFRLNVSVGDAMKALYESDLDIFGDMWHQTEEFVACADAATVCTIDKNGNPCMLLDSVAAYYIYPDYYRNDLDDDEKDEVLNDMKSVEHISDVLLAAAENKVGCLFWAQSYFLRGRISNKYCFNKKYKLEIRKAQSREYSLRDSFKNSRLSEMEDLEKALKSGKALGDRHLSKRLASILRHGAELAKWHGEDSYEVDNYAMKMAYKWKSDLPVSHRHPMYEYATHGGGIKKYNERYGRFHPQGISSLHRSEGWY